MTLEIKEGGFYVNRKGEKVGPISSNIPRGFDPAYVWTDGTNIYTFSGRYWVSGSENRDLIAEWSEPAAEPEWGEWGSWDDCEDVIRSGGDFQSEKIAGDTRYRVRKAPPAPVVKTETIAWFYGMNVAVDLIDGKPDWTTLKAVQS